MHSQTPPINTTDPLNARILAVSEDRLEGFQMDPLGQIARQSRLDLPLVIERLVAMLRGGTIRRIRQTLLATNLAQGALVAWQIPEDRLHAAFGYMTQQDPFSGHVVIRSTDSATAGAKYRLWTTLKVPQGFSIEKHCRFLAQQTGAISFALLPARCLFALGVGHVRRRGLEIGSKSEELADVIDTHIVQLSNLEWQVLTALKREFTPEELERTAQSPDQAPTGSLWQGRAEEAGVDLLTFFAVAQSLNHRGVIGRFSTFLEHVKPLTGGERVTKFNALFHWTVPPGREIDAGRQVGRFHIMTHCYWRQAGEEFGHVNIMGVAHGTDKNLLLQHKQAIDDHLRQVGIPPVYTNVFWGGRSEIKPSEIAPAAYRDWCVQNHLDPQSMRP